jgi:hypothetical protein
MMRLAGLVDVAVDHVPAMVHRSTMDPPYLEAVWPNLGRPWENQRCRRRFRGVTDHRVALPMAVHHGSDPELANEQPIRRF